MEGKHKNWTSKGEGKPGTYMKVILVFNAVITHEVKLNQVSVSLQA